MHYLSNESNMDISQETVSLIHDEFGKEEFL